MRRYLLIFFLGVSAILLPSAILSLIFEPIDGDLTRIGAYSERDFGWNASQPAIQINNNGKSITTPGMIVLGDSFSKPNAWQSVLSQKTQMEILSFDYGQAGCIDNWLDYAKRTSTAKIVAIETVEREFVSRFQNLGHCAVKFPIPFEMSAHLSSVTRKTWPPEIHIKHSFLTALHTFEMHKDEHSSIRGQVINTPITPLCARFSNHRADRLLYYRDDENKLSWENTAVSRAIANALSIQKIFAEHGKKFILIVVPDKLSVYQNCISENFIASKRPLPNITAALINAGSNTPDLINSFQRHINTTVDLYLPNNTHLSDKGYMLMADEIAHFLVKSSAVPPARDINRSVN